jgi:transcriptional regulator with XRE-family HTH domain
VVNATVLRCAFVSGEKAVAALLAKIKSELDARDLTQRQLAEAIGLDESVLSKMLSGRSLKRTQETFRRLADIEKAFKMSRGTLLRQLEYIGDQGETKEAILHDGSLPVDVKDALVAVVDHFARAPSRGAVRAAAETGEPPPLAGEDLENVAKHVDTRKPKP